MVAAYGTQIKGMRKDGKYKTRDSKKWKQVQARRSYGEVERPSRYLDETDIGAGDLDGKGRGHEVQGHDIVVGMNEAKGAGCEVQGHDTVMGMYEAEGTGRHVQGHDNVMGMY